MTYRFAIILRVAEMTTGKKIEEGVRRSPREMLCSEDNKLQPYLLY